MTVFVFLLLNAVQPLHRHVFEAPNLGEYAAWLDKHQLCQPHGKTAVGDCGNKIDNCATETLTAPPPTALLNGSSSSHDVLYDCLLEAITLNLPLLALSLLSQGVDSHRSKHGGRLSKVSGRNAMRSTFTSTPMHLSCTLGNPRLVAALLHLGHSCTSPDANGSFPMHLVCLKLNNSLSSEAVDGEDDADGEDRCKCLQLLLDEGQVPLTMKDNNKQTILHCVARSGNFTLAQFVIKLWMKGGVTGAVPTVDTYGSSGSDNTGGIWDWRDRWFRTPVQWAVLNGHVKVLHLLLLAGCSPCPPPSRKTNRSTSAESETPIQICQRLYSAKEHEHMSDMDVRRSIEKGRAIMALLTSSYPR